MVVTSSRPLSNTPRNTRCLETMLHTPICRTTRIAPLRGVRGLSSHLSGIVLIGHRSHRPMRDFGLHNTCTVVTNLARRRGTRNIVATSTNGRTRNITFSSTQLNIGTLVIVPATATSVGISTMHNFNNRILLRNTGFSRTGTGTVRLSRRRNFA